MSKEGNKNTKNVKGYHHDGLEEKLPSVYEKLHHENSVASDRMETRYDLRNISIQRSKTKMKIVHLGRLMKYDSDIVDV